MTKIENMPNNGEFEVSSSEKISREELLIKASELVRILHHRTTTKRFRNGQHDRPRLAYARVAVAAIIAYSAILKDAELDELKRRIEALEVVRQGGNNQK